MCARADEDVPRTRSHKAIDQVLRPLAIDLAGAAGTPLAPVKVRIPDVHVEPDLVRGVAQAAEAGPGVAAAPAAGVPDAHAGREGVGFPILPHDTQQRADQPVVSPTAPGAVRPVPAD